VLEGLLPDQGLLEAGQAGRQAHRRAPQARLPRGQLYIHLLSQIRSFLCVFFGVDFDVCSQ
jgi:hypothetical protein